MRDMDADVLIRSARRRGGLTLRQLAARAGTSHSTLSAYEHGRTTPTVATLERILEAAGFTADVRLEPTAFDDRVERGRELVQVLELAAEFPSRHDADLRFPRFGRP